MPNSWPRVSLGELLTLERRPVKIASDEEYAEIGIYCFGRGIFHKLPRKGLEVGDKDLYLIKEGDFILQVTFAWEGAVALASRTEDGMHGSVRFPTFRVDEPRCFPPYLVNYFRTREGLQQLVKICPGSAGRNRVLSIKRIPEVHVPLPPLDEQRRIVARIEQLAAKIQEARGLRSTSWAAVDSLMPCALRRVFKDPNAKVTVGQVLELQRGFDLPVQQRLPGPHPVFAANGQIGTHAEFRVKGPGVLTGRSGSVGAVNYVAVDFWPLNTSLFVKDFRGNLPRLTYYLLRAVSDELKELSSHTAVSTLDRKKVHSRVWVHLPAVEQQRRIVAYLDNLQAKVDALKRLQAETAAELGALLPSILDRAFRGEL